MRERPRSFVAAALAAVLILLLGACSGDDDGADAPPVTSAAGPSPDEVRANLERLEGAIARVSAAATRDRRITYRIEPGGATAFVAQRAQAKRVDHDGTIDIETANSRWLCRDGTCTVQPAVRSTAWFFEPESVLAALEAFRSAVDLTTATSEANLAGTAVSCLEASGTLTDASSGGDRAATYEVCLTADGLVARVDDGTTSAELTELGATADPVEFTPPYPVNAEPPAAPWAGEPLEPGAAPAVLLEQWEAASNAGTCAPLVPTDLAEGRDGTPRAAEYPGGWAVAWDRPSGPGVHENGDFCRDCGRGAFGIAGTAAPADPERIGGTLERIQYADGAVAGISVGAGVGPESSPAAPAQFLATLALPGQDCLYQAWSYVGGHHLRALLQSLRAVATG